MKTINPMFDKIYEDYLTRIGNLDFKSMETMLGIETEQNEAIIRFFNSVYKVSSNGIKDSKGKRPAHAICVVLCQYLLLCPEYEPEQSQWVSYKDFKDATPFIEGFMNNSERPISKKFSGRIETLKDACKKLGGYPPDMDINYQLSMQFNALPKVPILMLFNDKDEEFPAQTSLLFEKRAENYLDMECIAMIAWIFYESLIAISGICKGTLI